MYIVLMLKQIWRCYSFTLLFYRYGYNPFEFEAKNLVIKYLNLAETCDDSETLESIKYVSILF